MPAKVLPGMAFPQSAQMVAVGGWALKRSELIDRKRGVVYLEIPDSSENHTARENLSEKVLGAENPQDMLQFLASISGVVHGFGDGLFQMAPVAFTEAMDGDLNGADGHLQLFPQGAVTI